MSIRHRSPELGWAAAAGVILILLSSVPYRVGKRAETGGLVFNGAVFDRQDHAVHMAMMQAGTQGDWAYRLRFTSEPQKGAYLKQYYLLFGHAARLFPGEGYSRSLTVFRTGIWISGLFMCLAVYALFMQLFRSISVRRFGFAIALTASGFGWLQLLLGWVPNNDISPIDFWLIDAYPVFSLMTFPHFTSAVALKVGMIALYLSDLKHPATWKAVGVIIMGLAAMWIQPFAPALADVAMGGAFLSTWLAGDHPEGRNRLLHGRFPVRAFTILGLTLLAQLPLLLYNLNVFRLDAIMASFAAQNVTLSPPWLFYLLGFGPVGLLALGSSLTNQVDLTRPGQAAMLSWAVSAPILAYIPWPYQRRFMLAYTIPLAVLAAIGVRSFWRWWSPGEWVQTRRSIWVFLFVLTSGFSSLALVIGTAASMAARPVASFDPKPVVLAVDWLKEHADTEDVTLAGQVETMRLVAARSGLRVFWGHPIETIDSSRKEEQSARFYSGELGTDWLRSMGVGWVLAGVESTIDPTGLGLVYSDDGIQIYKVED